MASSVSSLMNGTEEDIRQSNIRIKQQAITTPAIYFLKKIFAITNPQSLNRR